MTIMPDKNWNRLLLAAVLVMMFPNRSLGFYLPGVAPTDYKKGEELSPKVQQNFLNLHPI
jgi:hypothetical protein